MRIKELHVFQKDLRIEGPPYTMARTELHSLDSTLVKLVADNGLSGWGETCPIGPVYQPHHALGARAALAELAPSLIGELVSLNTLHQVMDDSLNAHGYAKSAIDVAAHDLLGKHYGVPVSELLGGARVERVPSYYAIGIGTPEEVSKIAVEKIGEGYKRIQLKLGGRAIAEDIAVIRKTWEAIGPAIRLVVDPNRSLTASDTITLSQQCVDVPMTIEQPCNTMEELLSLRGRLCHPVAVDESSEGLNQFLRAIETGVCQGFGLKISRMGGLRPFSVVRDLCALRSMPHSCEDSWGGDIVSAACVHMGATVQPRLLEGVWLAQPYISEHYDPENGIKIENGSIAVPDRPGLGVVPDESALGSPEASY